MPRILVNGQWIDADAPALLAADRGFRFGDGVFETIRVTPTGPLLWEAHMARLARGLQALAIPFDVALLRPAARGFWEEEGGGAGFLRLSISRGVGGRGYAPPPDPTPTWVMERLPDSPPLGRPRTLGLSRYEKISPKALPTYAKTAQALQSVLARMEADAAGVDDVVLLDAEGHVAETSSANIFWWQDGGWVTPSLETGALAGVMRGCVMACAEVVEGAFPYAALQQAEAVFLTNVRIGIAAVGNDHPKIAAVQQRVSERIKPLTW